MKPETLQLCLEILTSEYNEAHATILFLEHQLSLYQEYRVDHRPEDELSANLLEQRKWRDTLEVALNDIKSQLK